MAAYDKSGYSHSETSLNAVIYVSSQVRLLRLWPLLPPRSLSRHVPTSFQVLQLPRRVCRRGTPPPTSSPMTQATLPPGQNRDFSGRGGH